MNNALNTILTLALAVIFAILTKYIIPYLRTRYEDARWNRLIDMVQVAVEAAEQTIHDKGEIKKEDVTNFVTYWLSTNDISVSSREIDRLIEAAVFKMNLKKAGDIDG